MPDLSGLWPGPSPDFPSLAPEGSSEDDYYFRCPDCRNLVAVGKWLRDGMYFECDMSGCFGQFYAALDVGANAEQLTPRGRSG